MNIVFVLRHTGYFRFLQYPVRVLCKRGHKVDVVSRPSSKNKDIDILIENFKEEIPECKFHTIEPTNGLWQRFFVQVRSLINYAFYFKPGHTSPALAKRWVDPLYSPLKLAVRIPLIQKLILNRLVQNTLRRVESFSRIDNQVMSWLSTRKPDLIVAVPGVYGYVLTLDFLKAAKSLNIPSVVSVASWDNLTTKGSLFVTPDKVIVWNQPMEKEAVEIHGIKPDKVEKVGAPIFDPLFDMEAALSYDEFCRRAGINPENPFIVYLASSKSIAGDETPFVDDFARSIRENEKTRKCTVMVRPHPLNAGIWEGYSAENVIVWPPGGRLPDSPNHKQDFYDSLYHSSAVVGVNTSAILEAAIVDKPCITIMTGFYVHSQSEMGHFQHLLDGNFIEVATSFSEAAALVANSIEGIDKMGKNRRKFLQNFIRPHGLDEPASEHMAIAIERAANC